MEGIRISLLNGLTTNKQSAVKRCVRRPVQWGNRQTVGGVASYLAVSLTDLPVSTLGSPDTLARLLMGRFLGPALCEPPAYPTTLPSKSCTATWAAREG